MTLFAYRLLIIQSSHRSLNGSYCWVSLEQEHLGRRNLRSFNHVTTIEGLTHLYVVTL